MTLAFRMGKLSQEEKMTKIEINIFSLGRLVLHGTIFTCVQCFKMYLQNIDNI